MKSNVNFYLYISMFLNIAISIMKIIAGTLLHSKALITDAMHSLSDLTTDFIGLFGNIISYKKPDKEHPFGHHNLEYIISSIIGICVIFLGVNLIKNGLTHKSTYEPSLIALLVIALDMAVKFIMAYTLIKGSKKLNSPILESSGKESFGDFLSSIIVIVAFVTGFINKNLASFMDIAASLIISIIIIRSGLKICFNNYSSLLMEDQKDNETSKKIKALIKNNNYFFKYTDLILIGEGKYYRLYVKLYFKDNIRIKEAVDIVDNFEKEVLVNCPLVRNVYIKIKYIDKK